MHVATFIRAAAAQNTTQKRGIVRMAHLLTSFDIESPRRIYSIELALERPLWLLNVHFLSVNSGKRAA